MNVRRMQQRIQSCLEFAQSREYAQGSSALQMPNLFQEVHSERKSEETHNDSLIPQFEG
jgi:hypothetical protein